MSFINSIARTGSILSRTAFPLLDPCRQRSPLNRVGACRSRFKRGVDACEPALGVGHFRFGRSRESNRGRKEWKERLGRWPRERNRRASARAAAAVRAAVPRRAAVARPARRLPRGRGPEARTEAGRKEARAEVRRVGSGQAAPRLERSRRAAAQRAPGGLRRAKQEEGSHRSPRRRRLRSSLAARLSPASPVLS